MFDDGQPCGLSCSLPKIAGLSVADDHCCPASGLGVFYGADHAWQQVSVPGASTAGLTRAAGAAP